MSLIENLSAHLQDAHDILGDSPLQPSLDAANDYLTTRRQIARTVALLQRLAAREVEQAGDLLIALSAASTEHGDAENIVADALYGAEKKWH